jgi:hypothetical protein
MDQAKKALAGEEKKNLREGGHMPKRVGWLWVVGIFGLSAAAVAQTPPPSTASTRFDGTYAFISSTKLNAAYTKESGRMGQCNDRIAGPLTIVYGHARYTGFGLRRTVEFEGTVSGKGELAMRSVGDTPNFEIATTGRIDGNGTIRGRQRGSICNYDFTWRKGST